MGRVISQAVKIEHDIAAFKEGLEALLDRGVVWECADLSKQLVESFLKLLGRFDGII
ncbi:MAG: hypothetical protein M3H12_08720 [Chromatiales bacterium]